MKVYCPQCKKESGKLEASSTLVRYGSYYRSSDGQWIQRYRCMHCKRSCSSATFNSCFRQKKRHKNEMIRQLLCSLSSQRRLAKVLKINRTTVVRKLRFLALRAERNLKAINQKSPKACEIEFDDLETFEHTKCKPISITIAVESKSRRILGLEISTMKAKGLLVGKARRYGRRLDTRTVARRRLFERIQPLVKEDCLIKSDMNPHYEKEVRAFFPNCRYRQYKGQRGSLGGQGELKKIVFDPLFSLNHTCAMLRANVNRLIRKTWCTTKRPDQLRAHLMIYADYHNSKLLKN